MGCRLPHAPSWRDESHSWDGLKPVGALDPDVRTIDSLYDSHMPHIQLMHPFLEKPGLRPLFDQSIKNYSSRQDIYGPFAVSLSDEKAA